MKIGMILGAMAISASLGVVSSAEAQSVNFPAMGIRLQEDMTENQVIQALGYTPSAVALETCGSTTAHPWQCKIYRYGAVLDGELDVYFAKDEHGTWVVNNWSTYP